MVLLISHGVMILALILLLIKSLQQNLICYLHAVDKNEYILANYLVINQLMKMNMALLINHNVMILVLNLICILSILNYNQ